MTTRKPPQPYQHDLPQPKSFNFRGILLYVLPSPLILKFLMSLLALSPMKMLMSGAAVFFYYSAAHLTRTTLTQLDKQKARAVAFKHIKDYRLLAMIYLGVATLIVMLMIKRSPLAMLIMPACAMLGYYLVYGIREKSAPQTIDASAIPKATREAIETAYKDLSHIERLAKQLSASEDQPIVQQAANVIEQSYVILDLLSQSPNDAGRARRFLHVYINRIKEIFEQYISLSQYDKATDYRQRLIEVLGETHTVFSEQQSKLLDDDQFKLDVQLAVLDEQIKQEKQ